MKGSMSRASLILGALVGWALLAVAVAGTAAAASTPAPAQRFQGTLSGVVDQLPGGPQLSSLPGASSVPNLSSAPGAPGVQGLTNNDQRSVTDPTIGGAFGAPFAEPGPACPGETQGGTPSQVTAAKIACKPAGVSVVVLPNGRVLYWDGLEGEENIKYSIVLEYGDTAANDQSRLLALNPFAPASSSWQSPTPPDGGADGSKDSQYLVPNAPGMLASILNDQGTGSGALFCSDQVLLSNGEVLAPGGTDYYAEPRVPGTPFGVAELQGLRNTRIYNPAENTWTQAHPMAYGRWYPSLVTLPNGHVFVASGVTKLLKPVYTSNPQLSGTNVEQTETFDPATGRWTANHSSASRTLPLFPRLHLLPDGHVFYDAGGQTFNPFGQSYDEALWNIAASYDPATQAWRNLGVPAGVSFDAKRPLATSLTAGFRGSAASVMLPLTPPYKSASFLDAGGVLGTSPGAYFANTSSVIDTVTTGAGGEHFSSTPTAPLNNARWFSSTVLLPTGQAIAFNGANRDDVVGPGTSFPVTQAELFDPASGTWAPLADSADPRTYHNSAVLLGSGQVLVGGNAPISTLYAYNTNIPGGFSNDLRDPSFQLYDPPYLRWGVARPTIDSVAPLPASQDIPYGETLNVNTPDAASIASVVLVRNTAFTHVVDGDQRSIVLRVTGRDGDSLHVVAPPNGNVAPPGPYLLFINKRTPRGLVPSVATQVFVGPQGAAVPSLPKSPAS
jgi:Domain of unknown function (DUF1929)